MNEWMAEWVKRLGEWMNERINEWMKEWKIKLANEWMNGR